jgi:hypothetical protein
MSPAILGRQPNLDGAVAGKPKAEYERSHAMEIAIDERAQIIQSWHSPVQ